MQLFIKPAERLVREVLVTKSTERKGSEERRVAVYKFAADRIEVVVPKAGVFAERSFEKVNCLIELIYKYATFAVRGKQKLLLVDVQP